MGELRRASRLVVFGLVGVLLAALLVACGTKAADVGPAESAVTITAKDNLFEPKAVTVPAGKAVTVTFTNAGKAVHEVEIKGLIGETKLQPGESRSFTIKPAKQTYKIYCEIHEDKGMEGDFTGE
jgi:plastocyanin